MSKEGDIAAPLPGKRSARDRAAFAARMQSLVARSGSIEKLARAANVSASALRKWLRGEAEPSRERLVAVAEACAVSIAWLVAGEDAGEETPKMAALLGQPATAVRVPAPPVSFVIPRSAPVEVASPASSGPLAFAANWIEAALGVDPAKLLVVEGGGPCNGAADQPRRSASGRHGGTADP